METIFKGCLERWNDDKGFGFICSEQVKEDVFVHVSAFKNISRRPVVGDVIYYQLHVGDDGKNKAISAKIEGATLVRRKTSSNDKRRNKKNWLTTPMTIVVLIVVGIFSYGNSKQYFHPESNGLIEFAPESDASTELITSDSGNSNHDLILKNAFLHRTSNLQAEGDGRVSKILSDDTDGNRHQKFIVTLNSGQTLLIAHNIDLAGRINSIQEGDRISFYGEYEWNSKGGVIHWTHHDPSGNHITGWLKHNGHTYQ